MSHIHPHNAIHQNHAWTTSFLRPSPVMATCDKCKLYPNSATRFAFDILHKKTTEALQTKISFHRYRVVTSTPFPLYIIIRTYKTSLEPHEVNYVYYVPQPATPPTLVIARVTFSPLGTRLCTSVDGKKYLTYVYRRGNGLALYSDCLA